MGWRLLLLEGELGHALNRPGREGLATRNEVSRASTNIGENRGGQGIWELLEEGRGLWTMHERRGQLVGACGQGGRSWRQRPDEYEAQFTGLADYTCGHRVSIALPRCKCCQNLSTVISIVC